MTEPRFRSVVLDVDSTLCGVEGIDWLARLRGQALADAVAAQTDRAMRGLIPLEAVFAARLALVQPNRSEIEALGRIYVETVAPGASEVVPALISSGVRVILLSSGIRQAVLSVGLALGIRTEDVNAVDLSFDKSGNYLGFDESSPLTVATGKRDMVGALELPRPVLAVGDGVTDLAMKGAVDAFCAFTGFTNRPEVVEEADLVISSFDELSLIVSGS